MKKRVLIIFIIIFIIFVIIGSNNVISSTQLESQVVHKKLNIIKIDYNAIDEDDIITNNWKVDYSQDISDYNALINESKYIIIGTITSIDGVTNYNPKTDSFILTRTVGQVRVDTVIKGNLHEKNISFIRVGGLIPFTEYYKAQSLEKINFLKLTIEGNENKYVDESFHGDIDIEEGKTYLMFLNYSDDFGRYSISGLEYGLREIIFEDSKTNNKVNNKEIKNISNITVLNNKTGKCETLNEILNPNIKTSIK